MSRGLAVATVAMVGLGPLAGCEPRSDPGPAVPPAPPNAEPRQSEPPVALDPTPGIEYPAALASHRIGGTVLLRMFVDSTGRVAKDSTRLQESSGYPALDSAALRAAATLRYAPPLRNGSPAAGPFLQPFTFRTRLAGAITP
jgi:protein TonB